MSKKTAGSVTLKVGTQDLTVFYSAIRTGHILEADGTEVEILSVMFKGVNIYPVLEFMENEDGYTKINEAIQRAAMAKLYGEKEEVC